MTEPSDLWKELSSTLFANVDDAFVAGFRKPGGANNRLASWDAFDPTMRYFKNLLYSASAHQPERFFSMYRAIGNVSIGSPVSVRIKSCDINIDYFLSVQELMFLESAVPFDHIRSVIEIGAGFGRTCHAILALNGDIERYTIVDLPEVLRLSRRVLSELLPDQMHKICFINAMEDQTWRDIQANLVVNIDSFQEMLPSAIDAYMATIIANSRYLYVKNPIAKYEPTSLGIEVRNPAQLRDVFSLGYCRDVIDVFDDEALATCRKKYIDAYRPGTSWALVADRAAEPFVYYHHALYEAL